MRALPSTPIRFFNPNQMDSRSWKTDLGAEGLRKICERLNLPEGDAEREELRRLVAAWRASGPCLQKMFWDNPGLKKALQETMTLLYDVPSLDSATACLNVLPSFPPEGKRGAGVAPYWASDAANVRALSSFYLLTLNPHWEKLAGPCVRCQNYFIGKRSTQKVYCSRRCGNAATAVARTRARLQADHQDKMQRARAAICEWNGLEDRAQQDWEPWLQTREPDITGKFITRHVNAGKLPEPKRGARRDTHLRS